MGESSPISKRRSEAKGRRPASTTEAVPLPAFTYPYLVEDGKPTFIQVPVDRYRELITAEAALKAASALQDENPESMKIDDAEVRLAKNRLVAARTARGLSQRELGKKLGMQQSHISNIEKNPDRVHLRTLKRVARALGVDVRSLI